MTLFDFLSLKNDVNVPWHGSADPDPDPHQNVMDPQHWEKRKKVRESGQAGEQHGSTELKTKFLKTTMCPLVRGNRKHYFNISGFHVRIRGKDCF